MGKSGARLEVSLKDRKSEYRPGDRVQGRAIIRADSPVRCQRLNVWIECLARPLGGTDLANLPKKPSQSLFKGELASGTERSFDVSSVVPNGPFSFEGKQFRLEWVLAAQIELADGETITVQEIFKVVPGEGAGKVELGPAYEEEAGESSKNEYMGPIEGAFLSSVLLGGLIMTPLTAIFLIAMANYFGRLSSDVPAGNPMLLIGAVVCAGVDLLCVAMVAAKYRRRQRINKLGAVLQVSPLSAKRGGAVQCRIAFSPRADAGFIRVAARLKCLEEITNGGEVEWSSGDIPVQEIVRMFDSVRVGAPLAFEADFKIPADAPITYYGDWSAVQWRIETSLWFLEAAQSEVGAPSYHETVGLHVIG